MGGEKRLNPWSEQYGFPIEKWPMEMKNRRDFPVRLISNPSDPTQLILCSFGIFCVINLKNKMPRHCRILPDRHVRRRRRKQPKRNYAPLVSPGSFQQDRPAGNNQRLQHVYHRKESANSQNCTICLHYNSMLYFNFLGPEEMIVIEQPWLQVVATFPEAVQRRVYGCN